MNELSTVKAMLREVIQIWIIKNFITPALNLEEWAEKACHLNLTVTLEGIFRRLDRNEYDSYFNLPPRKKVNVFMSIRNHFADELLAHYYGLCHNYKGNFQSPYSKLRYREATQVTDFVLNYGSNLLPEPETATSNQINYLIIQALGYDLPPFHVNSNEEISTPCGHVLLKAEASALLDALDKDGTFPYWVEDYRSI